MTKFLQDVSHSHVPLVYLKPFVSSAYLRVKSQHLMSTETLDRGLSLIRSATMSLESDPQYALMLAEKQKLLASWLI